MGFEFILINDKNSQATIKKHLRSRQSEQRRKRLKEWKQASVALKANSIVGHGPLAWRQKQDDQDECRTGYESPGASSLKSTSRHPSQSPAKSPSIESLSSTNRAAFSQVGWVKTCLDVTASVTTTHPANTLSAARRDPFATYPIPWHPDIDGLLDLYINLGPHCFQYPANPHHDLFRRHLSMSMADPAAFHALLLLATINHDRLSGRTLPGMRSVFHRVEAIRLINERLDSPDPSVCMSESTIYTVSRLHVLEKQWNAVGDHEVHTSGLHKLLVQKGGLRVLARQHPGLEIMVYLSALVTPGMLRSTSPALYQSDAPQIASHHEQWASALELVDFIDNIVLKAAGNRNLFLALSFAFHPTTAIHNLLTAPHLGNKKFTQHTQRVMEKVDSQLRIIILLHIHCMVLSLDSQKVFFSFVKHLEWIMRQEWLWQKSLRMLHYLLIQTEHSSNLADSKLAWKVLRLSDATKILDQGALGQLQSALLGTLSGRVDSAVKLVNIKEQLKPHVFR